MTNKDFYDEDLLNQPNEAFPEKEGYRKPSSKNSPVLFKIFAILYFLSALSAVCGLFPTLMSFQMYPAILAIFSIITILFQIVINGALGFGLWKLKAWAWWLITIINPLNVGFGLTLGFLMMRDMTNAMQSVLSGEEIAQAQGFYSIGIFIGAGFSLLIVGLFQLLFWSKRDLFFGSKKSPMSAGEFVLMQLVVIVFSVVFAIVVYLILQQAGFSMDAIFEQLEVYQTYSY